jgi:antitoxin component YwqK of YwqJK toxin-antitoxin module
LKNNNDDQNNKRINEINPTMINNSIDNLEYIKKKYSKFVGKEKYVFKKCMDCSSEKDKSRKWLVILKKIKSTRTNEERSGVINKNYAKFRANILKVIKIINVNDPRLIKKKIVNRYKNNILEYEEGKIVVCENYDENIEHTCSNGIHYYRTIEPAYVYGIVPKKYTGCVYDRDPNGVTIRLWNYSNGKRNGKQYIFYKNGNVMYQEEYINGKRSGEWIEKYKNGTEKLKEFYLDGVKSGKWNERSINGDIVQEGEYLRGRKTGKWIERNENTIQEGEYLEGRKTGKWTERTNIGTIKSEGEYKNNLKTGKWIEYNDDGSIEYDGEYFNGRRVGNMMEKYLQRKLFYL